MATRITCEIKWIDNNGQPTPDQNEAIMMAHFHEIVWSLPCGGPGNKEIGYNEKIAQSIPICAAHYAQVTPGMHFPEGGWSFTPLELTANELTATGTVPEDQSKQPIAEPPH